MKQKHLTLEEREIIEDMLKENINFTEIGKAIGKHRTTISKEILNHRIKNQYKQFNSSFANCELTYNCVNAGSKQCKNSCPSFKEKYCPNLTKAPYVCNACDQKKFVDCLNIIIEQKMQILNIKI